MFARPFVLFGRCTHFAFASLWAGFASIRRPHEVASQLFHILIGALPLGFVAGVALGVVVWVHLHNVVEQVYAAKVPEYLALAVALEFAPLGAGLVIGGRTGASLAAELSSMKLTEQIDALEAMGVSPMRRLVGPRVLACMLALPLLTVFLGAFALGSSFLAEMIGGTMFPTPYQNALLAGLARSKLAAAILKTTVFGWLIAVAGCWCGLHPEPGAEGVGIAATRGVVASIFAVMIANVLLVQVIQMLP
ncbi:MAG: ABC transporter permease [Gemmataceae bacterium]|nr:ABC transporter permease [Gemmataceae bacterium]